MKIKFVTLTNGARVPALYVLQVLKGAEDMLANNGPVPLYELLQLCKNPDHRPFGGTGDIMKASGFLSEWDPAAKRAIIHDLTRDVILAAVRVEGLDVCIARRSIIVSVEEVDVD